MSAEIRPGLDRPLRILVIDDARPDRVAVIRALREADLLVEVIEAHDVESARAAMGSGSYDCLLIDQVHPSGDGHEVLEVVARLGLSTPAIVLTGSDDEPISGRLAMRGEAYYLPRSQISPERLLHCIANALHADTLQRREADALRRLSQHAARLDALVESSMRIHAASTVDEVVEATAAEALALFRASEATVELDASSGRKAVSCTATGDASSAGDRALTRALCDRGGRRLGSLRLAGAGSSRPTRRSSRSSRASRRWPSRTPGSSAPRRARRTRETRCSPWSRTTCGAPSARRLSARTC